MSDFTEIVMLLKEIHLPTCRVQIFDDTFLDQVDNVILKNSHLKELEVEYNVLSEKADSLLMKNK